MCDDDEKKLYEDWKGFLQSDRSDIRLAAVNAVLEVRDREGMEKIIKHDMVSLLAKNASYDDDLTVSVNALKALVHLSSHGTSTNQCIADLLQAGGLNRMLEIVLSSSLSNNNDKQQWNKRVNYAMSLLANMTRTEEGAVELVGRTLPEQAVLSSDDSEPKQLPTKPTMELLLARFLNPAYSHQNETTAKTADYYDTLLEDTSAEAALDSDPNDPYQHFAAVLMNSTQTEAGRRFVLKIHHHGDDDRKDKKKNSSESAASSTYTVLQKLLPQLKSPNPVRRRGIAGTLRNCCLERDSAWWYLNVVKLTKHLLYPLAGPEELDIDEKQGLDVDLWIQGPDKKREPDHLTRLFLVESILLLCTTGRASRETLRLERAYVILKWADMVEQHEDVSERIYDIVNFLRRDEQGTQEGSSDKLVEEAYRKPSAARQVGSASDKDDFDNVD